MIRVVKNGWTTLYKEKSTQKLPKKRLKKKLWIIMQATIIFILSEVVWWCPYQCSLYNFFTMPAMASLET